MRSRSSAVNRFIFARLLPISICIETLAKSFLTDFETTLVLVADSSLGSLGKVVHDGLHLDEPVSQIHSSKNGFVDELD
jgi:hypothetical protein